MHTVSYLVQKVMQCDLQVGCTLSRYSSCWNLSSWSIPKSCFNVL